MNTVKFRWILALIGALLTSTALFGEVIPREYRTYTFFAGFIPFIALFWGFSTKCPECGKWWASSEEGSEKLDGWQETKDVKRVDITKDRHGREISSRERIEQVIVNCEKRRHHYKCKYCEETWTEVQEHRDR